MKVYLIQHGRAKSEEEDPARPLSNEGIEDVNKTALFLKNQDIKVHAIIHSEKLRTKQTAKILSDVVKSSKGLEEMEWLKPNDNVNIMGDFIKNQINNDLMLVGHLPYMDKLSALLITGNEEGGIVKFQQGAVVCLERQENDKFELCWMIIPDIV